MASTPIRHFNDTSYIRIDILPLEDQRGFTRWLDRQTCPVIATELDAHGRPAACAYAWDYARWVHEGKPSSLGNPFNS